MMWHGEFGWGHMVFGGLFWILALILIVWIVVRILGPRQDWKGSYETPIGILEKRYAKGEISRKEFERMKKDLE